MTPEITVDTEDRAHIAPVFKASAESGYRFLVVISEGGRPDDVYARAVETAEEIVPLLRRVDRMAPDANNIIINVYDLTHSWDEQKADGLALQMSYLPEKTRHDLRVYYETREAARQQAAAEKAWAAQPLLKRLFTAKPDVRSA